MSGIKDVAALAGVSISTVSNVINKSKYVSPDLEARVNKAITALGFEVNPLAASMKSKKSRTIGIITEDMCGVFYPYIIRGISSVADKKGYNIIICDVNGRKDTQQEASLREKILFRKLITSRVDGIIFTSSMSGVDQDEYFLELKKLADKKKNPTPIVSLERDLTMLRIDSVYFDGYHNAQKAVLHLIDCGCRRICHIAGPPDLKIVQERIEGYEKCLSEHGLEFKKEQMLVYGDYTHRSGYIAMEQLLHTCPGADGVFCSNDQMAIGALKYLKAHGILVPERIKLIGYDDVFVSSIVEPAISTIHIQKNTAGREAADILFRRIEGREASDWALGIKLESRLIVRRSTVENAREDWDLNEW